MLLQSLKLNNIRSYINQTIDFPQSSTMLSGDIGSGKSTLLLAVEFALFGIAKPDLTGETLLRKGATSASVELCFQLENKTIIVQRNLKKTKNAITQSSGHLIINQTKKELTPSELKAEVINLLHYPEELITKSKNYLFRYTLYCPQEEMKLILQENADSRLDILRKIFNLDKYKTIRENLEIYLRKMRTRFTVLKTKLEPLEHKNNQLQELRKQEQQLTTDLNRLIPQLQQTKTTVKTDKQKLNELEQENQLHQELNNKHTNLQNLITEKNNQLQQLTERKKQLEEKITTLTINRTKDQINRTLIDLQKQQHEFLATKTELTTKITNCQQQVLQLQQEIADSNQKICFLQEKEQQRNQLTLELKEKENLIEEKQTTEALFDEIKKTHHHQQLLLSRAQEIKQKISQLDQCPTCLQDVNEQYKNQVTQQQQQQIENSEKQLQELDQKKSTLQKQLENITQQHNVLIEKGNTLTKLQTELLHLQEQQRNQETKKRHLRNLTKENNTLVARLELLKPEDLTQLDRQIAQQQQFLLKITQKQELEQQLAETNLDLAATNTHLEQQQNQRQQLEQALAKTSNLNETIQKQKLLLDQLLEEEKELFSKQTKINTQIENVAQQITSLVVEINQLNQYKSNLARLTEIHYWLTEFFVKLTYNIEKQVLVKIHHLFNHLFQEWFSLLIEDENFAARLDESFTPIIEQNGYEIFFNNLSGGERTAASLSYRLALNKVINDIVMDMKTSDLLILDEPTDGFSSEQLDKVRDVLEKLNLKQTIIVSHESKIESFVENVIRVSKREGVSQIG